MIKKYLIAVDLEGIHGVVGEPYKGLSKAVTEYKIAVENATREVNVAISALFDGGADEVIVWDNHGGKDNLDFSKIDKRAQKIIPENNGMDRLNFLSDGSYKAMLFIGYHSREGTLGGVLAHTYNSSEFQYFKLNGKAVGEFDIDSILAEAYGVPTLFLSSDNVCVEQFKETHPNALTAVTKIGKGRNAAEFLPVEKVLKDIYDGVLQATQANIPVRALPFPCSLEVRYTRMERAAEVYVQLLPYGLQIEYGEDAHILKTTLKSADELKMLI